MNTFYHDLLINAYNAFNERNIDAVISLLHPDVEWPNGWEGGYLKGHNQVRDYWERQWKEINPHVIPISLTEREDGRIEVEVHQIVKDVEGKELMNGKIKHNYTFENGLIIRMEIEEL